MQARVYGSIVIHPVSFPDKLQVLIFPLDLDDAPLGGCFPSVGYRSLDWVRSQYSLSEDAERRLRSGERANVLVGFLVADFPDDAQFPAGARVERL